VIARRNMLKTLIKIADKLDAEKKADLASKVDETIAVFSARKKAPLKHLDEKVKRDLVGFVHKVEKNLDESVKSLEEFFRRLRYFDLSSLVKETGLNKTVDEIKAIHDCVDNAMKKIYELSYGKKPSKGDVEQMLEDSDEDRDALTFFKSQQPEESEVEEKVEEEEGDEEIPASFWEGEGEDEEE